MITANNLAFVKLTSWSWRRRGSLEQWGSCGDSLVTNIGLAARIVGVLDHAALRGKVLVRWASTSQTNAWLSKFEQNLGLMSCEFQIKLCSILKKKLILSNIVQNEIYGQFAYILYLLVQNNVRFNNCQAMVSNFRGGGEENISFFRRIFLEYIFFKSVTNTSKYIWWAWFTTLIYRTFVYLCSLLISGCSSFPSDNFRHGLNGSHVNLNNILNIFQSFVNIQCFRQEFTITCRYICTGQRKRPHRYTCSHTHRPMSAPVDGSDPCKCKLRLKKS